MQQLPPLFVRDGYWTAIEKEIDRVLRELIYAPLMRVLDQPNPEYHNAANTYLVAAMRGGNIWYENGRFFGAFNARAARELKILGAIYNTKSKTWTLPAASLPAELRAAQAHADNRYDALRRGFIKTLGEANIDSIDEALKSSDAYKRTIDWMDDDFQKSVKQITIAPTITEAQRTTIAQQWGQNLNLYIKDWASKEIITLREKVQAETFTGRRAESLEAMIRESYGVSKAKARFLARQESSLLMSKFRETRYGECGVKKYRWSTSKDERVRSAHKHLHGKVFSFDSPPVTDPRTGARNNPGEDFNCRCIAIGLVE